MSATTFDVTAGAGDLSRSPVRLRWRAVVTAGLIMTAWILLAPQQLGGRVAYVTTSGASMHPLVRAGDLVALRSGNAYEVGDVVAYRNQLMGGRIVLHRIIGRTGDRYVLKGDANDFVDSYQPRASDLIGRMWQRVPGGGRIVSLFREPWRAAALVAALGTFAIAAGPRSKRRRRSAAASRPTRFAGGSGRGKPGFPPRLRRAVSQGAAGLLALSVGLGALAFTTAPTHGAASGMPFEHRGRFGYQADVPDARVYQGGLSTKDPVFLSVVDELRVRFDYTFSADAVVDARGRVSVSAVLRSPDGWTHTLVLAPETPFEGTATTTTVTLDLHALRERLSDVERRTGVTHDTYTVEIRPHVAVEATLRGESLTSDFEPTLPMYLGPSLLRPPGDEAPDAFEPVVAGSIRTETAATSALGVGPIRISVAAARGVATAGMLLGAAALLLLRSRGARRPPADEVERIIARYGTRIVSVRSLVEDERGQRAEVGSIDTVVALAREHERPVLHVADPQGDRFVVNVDGGTFVYVARRGRDGRWTPPGTTPQMTAPDRHGDELVDVGT